MIIEASPTPGDAQRAVNFAPLGVEWGEDEIVVKPFLEPPTFQNLPATRAAVVNVTDAVMQFAQRRISNDKCPAGPAPLLPGLIL